MTIKEIIQKLNTTIADHRGHESHFESWLTLIEGIIDAIDALKALDKQEPVAWIYRSTGALFDICPNDADEGEFVPLYTTPPQRTWVGLTDDEMYRYCPIWLGQADFKALMLHIEAKLKDKNI